MGSGGWRAWALDGPQVMRIVPAAFVVLPGTAMDFDLDGQIVFFVAQLGPGHDAVFVGVAVGVLGWGGEDGFDDREVFFIRADLLRGLDTTREPEGAGFFGFFIECFFR